MLSRVCPRPLCSLQGTHLGKKATTAAITRPAEARSNAITKGQKPLTGPRPPRLKMQRQRNRIPPSSGPASLRLPVPATILPSHLRNSFIRKDMDRGCRERRGGPKCPWLTGTRPVGAGTTTYGLYSCPTGTGNPRTELPRAAHQGCMAGVLTCSGTKGHCTARTGSGPGPQDSSMVGRWHTCALQPSGLERAPLPAAAQAGF